MRDIPEKDKCATCSPDKFCPRGPFQDICVKLSDIKSIVNFAQIPQRLAIIYDEPYVDPKGNAWPNIKIRHLQTWNFPSFTKTSKFYVNIVSIMNGLKFEKHSIMPVNEDTLDTNNGGQTAGRETGGGHGHGETAGEENEKEEDH